MTSTRCPAAVFVLIGLCVAEQALARTWIVDTAGGGNFTRIADACKMAQSGDTVALRPGEYDEYNGPFGGGIWVPDKALSLIGLGVSPEDVRVQAQIAFGGERVLVQGISFHGVNRALDFRNATLTMRHCRFLDNVASLDAGGAIYATGGVVTIEDCEFLRNRVLGPIYGGEGNGGAIFVGGDDITIRRCWFEENEATGHGGAINNVNRWILIEDCVFIRNRAYNGAALSLWESPNLAGCTFFANETTWSQGAAIELSGNPQSKIERCIVAGTVNGYGVGCWNGTQLECFCFWNNERGPVAGYCTDVPSHGNFTADPQFCNPEFGDFHLQDGSPCLPGLHNGVSCGLVGALSTGCLTPAIETTWGRIKAQFRSTR